MTVYVCVGSGPSLSKYQLDYIQDKDVKIIATNDNFKVTRCDFLFAADLLWWRRYYHEVCDTVSYQTMLYTILKTERIFTKNTMNVNKLFGIDTHREPSDIGNELLYHGGCSGILSIELARIMGAEKIILIGYDFQHTGGKSHWFGDHPKGFLNANACERWCREIAIMDEAYKELGIDFVNCTNETAIDSVRRSTLEKEM